MKHLNLIVAVVLASLLSAGAANAQLPSQPYLYGVWEGVMTNIPHRDKGDGQVLPFEVAEQYPFRLDIRDTNLVMYFPAGEGQWVPFGEGLDFRLNQAGRSATVLMGLSDGSNGAATESWVLNVVRWDEENISVYFSQVKSRDPSTGAAPSSLGAFGQMKRVSSDD